MGYTYKMKNEPIRHHYIPQFILRAICNDEGHLNYYDVLNGTISQKKPIDVFVTRNLYRDEINYPGDPTKIEADLAEFEREASEVINRFSSKDEIQLTIQENEMLKFFFAIMSFRGDRINDLFANNSTKEFKELYGRYQGDGNFTDLWKRNLGSLVVCRSLKQVLSNPLIDEPIKIFMRRDVFGVSGQYFMIVERRGKEDFLISDCYPALFEGYTDGRIKLPLYSAFPISPKRALVLVASGAENAPESVLGFEKSFFRRPSQSRDEKNLIFRVQKIYEPDVVRINDVSFKHAAKGVAAKSDISLRARKLNRECYIEGNCGR